jgi:tRNA-Thr(GGU) m(6)t(6)A37 methyltransferase TsaA
MAVAYPSLSVLEPCLSDLAFAGMSVFGFEPIGIARTPSPTSSASPANRGLRTRRGGSCLHPPFARREAFSGLEGFSHVWLLWVFHDDCLDAGWKPVVRPPRLGGKRKVGVFASRAPYRPNPIGLSAVAQHGLKIARGLALRVSGVDLLDGTPILDIKPYVPYADGGPDAMGGFAAEQPETASRCLQRARRAEIAARDPTAASRWRGSSGRSSPRTRAPATWTATRSAVASASISTTATSAGAGGRARGRRAMHRRPGRGLRRSLRLPRKSENRIRIG